MKKVFRIIVGVLLVVSFCILNNKLLVTTTYKIESKKLPKAFDGMRIVQVSDLHDATFGNQQERLIKKVQEAKPNAIFLTGDVIDRNRYDLEGSMQAVAGFVKIAPVYYVTGNHEIATNRVSEIKAALTELGVEVLSNNTIPFEKDGETIQIVGIEDPLAGTDTQSMLDTALYHQSDTSFKLLLAHRPEKMQTYAKNDIDITFSGHAHGGQFRLPGVGGLISPGQGFFPKYTAGTFTVGNMTQVISRGLGNSLMPVRLLNLPEIIVVELHSTKS
ncbi:metallophosphoesterase [Viridibacillus sp. YIM B01967]|uniref:Metallophosphoesterase n=1 Tax=Viridibacillus soli TaxID=2798301 RepID=A0ABS1H930_9BACL|nr:metallophosphoesterase [Viridibacillus soli]MBK3495919.1 metallophosphoesterase [Viridibacillus soli]